MRGPLTGGFEIINGTTSRQVQDMYFVENRTYGGYDDTLKTGPYNFGWASTKPDWVERFPYQNGMLVWFANGEFDDNNTSAHPGGGQVLPVDARPAPVMLDGNVRLGNRRQPFDATFGQEATDAVTFHRNGVPTTVPSSDGIPRFDDSEGRPVLERREPVGLDEGRRLGHQPDRLQDAGRRRHAAGEGPLPLT